MGGTQVTAPAEPGNGLKTGGQTDQEGRREEHEENS